MNKILSLFKKSRRHSHYFIDVSDTNEIDVYDLCARAGIDDPSGATQHALKKVLFPGKRGHKDRVTDLKNVVDTMNRLIEIENKAQKRKDGGFKYKLKAKLIDILF